MIYKDCRFCNWCPVHFRGSVDLVQQFFLKVGCLTLYFLMYGALCWNNTFCAVGSQRVCRTEAVIIREEKETLIVLRCKTEERRGR